MLASRKNLALSQRELIIENTILLYTESEVDADGNPIDSVSNTITADLEKFITSTDDGIILKLAIINPQIDRICQAPVFDSYWKKLWQQCGTNPDLSTSEPVHQYAPIPTLSCLQQLKGLYLYQLYLELTKKGETLSADECQNANEYLALSAHYGCFFALNALCDQGLKYHAQHPSDKLATEILGYAQQAATLHWTPGYILLSSVCQELAAHITDTETETGIQCAYLNQALQALSLAQKLEPYSQAMTKNAYQGKTLFEASDGNVSSWFQAKIRLINFSKGILTISSMHQADKLAENACKMTMKQFGLTTLKDAVIIIDDTPQYKKV